jgi:heme/copper-type cytochrome/quinol oxidase subunit 2
MRRWRLNAVTIAALLLAYQHAALAQARVIEILADHDSRYKMPGQKEPVIAVRPGEQITLRITAVKAKNRNRDGSIHGFTLVRAKDRRPVPDWDFLLKPGTQEFTVTAPTEAGEYVALCTVICSENHEGMMMKVVVSPRTRQELKFMSFRM